MGICKDDILYPKWSVIIPILNEARNLDKLIKHIIKVRAKINYDFFSN